MFVEVAIGIGVAMVVMVAVAQLVAVISHQQAHAGQIRLASREAANALEHVMASPWDELQPDAPPSVAISEGGAERLDDPRLSVVITESKVEVDVKRIEVRIDWLNRAGQRGEPFRLIAWRHAQARHAQDQGDRTPPADNESAE